MNLVVVGPGKALLDLHPRQGFATGDVDVRKAHADDQYPTRRPKFVG